jgi:hypothetical protein
VCFRLGVGFFCAELVRWSSSSWSSFVSAYPKPHTIPGQRQREARVHRFQISIGTSDVGGCGTGGRVQVKRTPLHFCTSSCFTSTFSNGTGKLRKVAVFDSDIWTCSHREERLAALRRAACMASASNCASTEGYVRRPAAVGRQSASADSSAYVSSVPRPIASKDELCACATAG